MSQVSSSLFACLALVLVGHALAKDNWEHKVDEDGRKVQSMQIQAPSMTEEDQYGYTMPDQYRCDSCKVVAYHLNEALKRRQPKNRRLLEWEYHELFDETCKGAFEGYGVALINGQNMLSGPAIKRDSIEPGMGAIQMGGETWSKRLGEICRKFVYEKIGEDEVYEHFRSQGEVSSDLCFSGTRDCKVGKEPTKKSKKSKKSPSEKKQKDSLDQKLQEYEKFIKEQPKTNAEAHSAESSRASFKAAPAAIEQQKKLPETNSEADATVPEISVNMQADAAVPGISINAFVSHLAKKHGVATTEYTKKRSFAEWEQMMALVEKRISEKEPAQVVEV